MRFISEDEAGEFFEECIKEALKSTCLRSKCGSVIANGNKIIGKGFNSPPGNLESQRKCDFDKGLLTQKVSDKTCCIHAEQRAIIDALSKNPREIYGSTIFFARGDNNGNMLFSGKPYCTHCSKLALDVGIKEFVLWHKEGICTYETEEYNLLSFNYGKQ